MAEVPRAAAAVVGALSAATWSQPAAAKFACRPPAVVLVVLLFDVLAVPSAAKRRFLALGALGDAPTDDDRGDAAADVDVAAGVRKGTAEPGVLCSDRLVALVLICCCGVVAGVRRGENAGAGCLAALAAGGCDGGENNTGGLETAEGIIEMGLWLGSWILIYTLIMSN